MNEREVKLAVDERFELPDLNGAWDGCQAAPRTAQQLSTVYLDSDDLRLARWGASLRYREGQGWTVSCQAKRRGRSWSATSWSTRGIPKCLRRLSSMC